MARVTLQDLADQLGLSKFSVSRALTGKPGVSEATRQRIIEAAREIGYSRPAPSPTAGGRILIVFHDAEVVNSELWLALLHGAQAEAARHELEVVVTIAATGDRLDPVDRSVVGIVLAGHHEPELEEAAGRTGVPLVTAGWPKLLAGVDQVTAADWEAGVHIARYFAGLGHRTMGYVHGRPGLRGRVERGRGFRDGVEELADCTLHEMIYDEGDNGFRSAFLRLASEGIAPTALYCTHDGIGVTVISELARLGLRVPEDISVVGYFDFACATQIVPQLTTMRAPIRQTGVVAVRCIVERLHEGENKLPGRRIQLVPEFIERDSTGPATKVPLLPRLKVHAA